MPACKQWALRSWSRASFLCVTELYGLIWMRVVNLNSPCGKFGTTKDITFNFIGWAYVATVRQEDAASLEGMQITHRQRPLLEQAFHFHTVQRSSIVFIQKKPSPYTLAIFSGREKLRWKTCHRFTGLCNHPKIRVPHLSLKLCPFHFPLAFVRHVNPSRVPPLDNSIFTTKLRAIKGRLRCNSEPGALVCAPSSSYLIHL